MVKRLAQSSTFPWRLLVLLLLACVAVGALVISRSARPAPFLVSIQTNLDAAERLRVPKGSGFFLIDRSARDSDRKPLGIIFDPPQPKS